MAVLTRALVVFAWVGCYDPTLQDCTLTCAGPGECASGQVCQTGLCVSVGRTCAAPIGLQIDVMGSGHVVLDGDRACATSCTFAIAIGVTHELVAVPDNKPFDGWSGDCDGAAPACSLPGDGDATVAARFK